MNVFRVWNHAGENKMNPLRHREHKKENPIPRGDSANHLKTRTFLFIQLNSEK